jgi:hypothetical protein
MSIKQWLLSSDKRKAGFVLLAMLLLIVITRTASLEHGMALHPDEGEFDGAASSVVKGDYVFKPINYPGGAFVFQMPFQFLGRIIKAKNDWPEHFVETQWGRIASVFYFSAACFMGGVLLFRNFNRSVLAVFFYALTMVFSLFQIEQSRYGTGDAISFFVLMVIIYALDIFFRQKDYYYLYFSAFFVGVLMAIKFPLVFFVIYPLCALAIKEKQAETKNSPLKPVCSIFVFVLLGLLLFTPQWPEDKTFFMKTFFRELNPYILGGRSYDVDIPLNHLAYLLIYQLFYSDFPLAALLFVAGVVVLYRENKKQGFTNAFYTLVLPVSIALFFFYNLFTSYLVFRTYYPYFCLCVFFTSYALSVLFSKKNYQIAIIALSAFMVLRGSFFTYALSEDSLEQPVILDTLTQHEEWENRRMVVTFANSTMTGRADIPQRKYEYGEVGYFFSNMTPTLLPGEFGVTSSIEYGVATTSLFRAGTEKEKLWAGWTAFREQNKDYLIGVSYPPYYHHIFGGWVSGSTLASVEFPLNYIYYRSAENSGDPQKYYPLYDIDDWQEYLAAIARLDCTIILSSNGDLPEYFARAVFSALSIDFGAPLSPGRYCVFAVQPGNAGPKELLQEYSDGAISLSLAEIIGTPSDITVSAEKNVVTVSDRSYATNTTGFNIVVCDRDMKCVMDWRSLIYDAEDESIVLRK